MSSTDVEPVKKAPVQEPVQGQVAPEPVQVAPKEQSGGKRRKTRRAGNPWTDLVKRVFKENKHKSGYKFKHALMDAKKVYKGSVVEPNRVGTRAAKTVATSIAKTVGRFADNAVRKTRGRRTRGRGRK
jgi:hypothetical protein